MEVIVAIAIVFVAGYLVGRRRTRRAKLSSPVAASPSRSQSYRATRRHSGYRDREYGGFGALGATNDSGDFGDAGP